MFCLIFAVIVFIYYLYAGEIYAFDIMRIFICFFPYCAIIEKKLMLKENTKEMAGKLPIKEWIGQSRFFFYASFVTMLIIGIMDFEDMYQALYLYVAALLISNLYLAIYRKMLIISNDKVALLSISFILYGSIRCILRYMDTGTWYNKADILNIFTGFWYFPDMSSVLWCVKMIILIALIYIV